MNYYAPNVEAATLLIREILPLVRRQLPDAHLLIVGKWLQPELFTLAATYSHVLITGEVSDAARYFHLADVRCVPLNSGGGTRFKILEAFAAGLPVASSSKGAEGLLARNGRELLIADTAHEMADRVVQILSDRLLRRRLCSSAKKMLMRSYTSAVAERQLNSVLVKYGLVPKSTPRIDP